MSPERVAFALTLPPFGLRSAGAALLSAGASMAQSAVMTASAADSRSDEVLAKNFDGFVRIWPVFVALQQSL